MNDAERKKLVAELRGPSLSTVLETCADAADEIERLQGENDWLHTALRASETKMTQKSAPELPTGARND